MKLGRLNLIAIAALSLSACTSGDGLYAYQCRFEGPAVGKSELRVPLNPKTRKIYWSPGSSDFKPLAIDQWDDAIIKGQFQIANKYTLTIDVAKDSATLDSVNFRGKKETSSGSCTKVELSDEERQLVGEAGVE